MENIPRSQKILLALDSEVIILHPGKGLCELEVLGSRPEGNEKVII